ncbi:MAG: hypothetical protein EAX86_07865 [Candidatus Heimdallarchaeota archaeon]|nr:hypothetical protein [Candidatus Heimdallarchaeota archaeon]
MIRTIRKFSKKTRGISPVIATVLLIGLAVVAGIAVALVVFGTLNTPTPLRIEIISISDFKTTDDDTLIDQFSVTLHNTERTNGLILTDSFKLFFQNLTEQLGWEMNLSNTQIILPALEIQTIPLYCNPNEDQNELTPKNDTLYIEVTVYPESSTNPRNAKKFRSDLLIMGDTYGPVSIQATAQNALFDDLGNNISITATNLGSMELDLYLEFSTTDSQDIFFAIGGENKTRFDFSIGSYGEVIMPNLTSLYPTEHAVADQSFIILITLWDQNNFRLLASRSLLLTYTG